MKKMSEFEYEVAEELARRRREKTRSLHRKQMRACLTATDAQWLELRS